MSVLSPLAAAARFGKFASLAGLTALSFFAAQTSAAQTKPSTAPPVSVTAHPRRPMFGTQPVRKVAQNRDKSRALPDDAIAAVRSLAALPPQTVALAPFLGNQTAILATSGNGLVMARQSDCSISAANVPYTANPSDPYSTPVSETPHYDQVLHNAAGLTTTGGAFSSPCPDPTIGVSSNSLYYAGVSTGGKRMAAVAVYNPATDNNVLYTFVINSDGTFGNEVMQTLPSTNAPYGVVAADLNGDGNPDLVAIGWTSGTSGNTSAATILLGNADGTFIVGQTYTFGTGFISDSAVIDDFNGDGKLDIVVAVGGANTFSGGVLTFLPGKGDGTFGTAKTLALSTASEGFVSGDFNGDGKKDLVSGTGAVFLGNGDGTFTPVSTPVFSGISGNSTEGLELATGDFNKDGKLDLAAGTGDSIYFFLGKGDGTFTPGNVFASIDNHGHVMATDIDGDGNLDVYSGTAQSGIFGGDDFTANAGYALMGHGDGSFAGAPQITNTNFNTMQDLNGDGKLDFIGVANGQLLSYNGVFSTYYGNGDGTFRQAPGGASGTTVSNGGNTYSINSLDSFTTGDINNDGHPDLIYLPGDFISTNPTRFGFVTAIANADGSFQTPQYVPVPSLSGASLLDDYIVQLSGLSGATNQNGKFEIIYGFAEQVYNESDSSVSYNTGFATQVANGDGTFAAPIVTLVTSGKTAPANEVAPLPAEKIVDLNGDKIPDMVLYVPATFANVNGTLTMTTPSAYQVMLGKADGSFSAATTLSLVNNPVENTLAVGDINGDGIPDLIAQGENISSGGNITFLLGIALGKGDGTFTQQASLTLTGDALYETFAIGDFNGDGKADIAMNGQTSGMFPGNGDGTFQSAPDPFGDGGIVPKLAIELASSQGPTGAFDVNGDGKMDLVAGGTFYLQIAPTTTLNTSSTSLSANSSSIIAGQNLTLSATVNGTSGTGTPTGSVTFMDGTTTLMTVTIDTSGNASFSPTGLAVGSHSFTATYSGDGAFSGSISPIVPVTVTSAGVTPVASTTVLTTTTNAITAGASVQLTATVTGPTDNTTVPTGNVTFYNGTTSLGSGTLNGSGVATLATTALPVGTNSVTAIYAGDGNFNGSTSSAVTITVSAPTTPDFSISLSPTSASITSGSSTTTTVTIQPLAGFNQAITLACVGLPAGASCNFTSSTVTPAGTGASTSMLTITTAKSSAMLLPNTTGGSSLGVFAASCVLIGFSRARRKRWFTAKRTLNTLTLLSLVTGLGLLAGCGSSSSSSGPAPVVSTITVTATSANISHTAPFTLTLQ